MKNKKTPVIILACFNVLLIALCVMLYLRTDRTPPVIDFTNNDLVYTEKTQPEELLEGVSAWDLNDGKLTSRIAIERIAEDVPNNKVVVFYAVSDFSGNVAESSREFPALLSKGDKQEEVDVALAEEIEPTPEPVATPEPTPEPVIEMPTEEPLPTPEPTPEPTQKPKTVTRTKTKQSQPEPAPEQQSADVTQEAAPVPPAETIVQDQPIDPTSVTNNPDALRAYNELIGNAPTETETVVIAE